MTKIRWNELVFGKRKDPNDPTVHQHLSLVAFLAWVGLGADGLSSACYGPEVAVSSPNHVTLFVHLFLSSRCGSWRD